MAFGLGEREPLYGRCTLDTFAVSSDYVLGLQ